MLKSRSLKILAAVLTASIISGSTVPALALNLKFGQDDAKQQIREEYVPGEAVICVRGSAGRIDELTEQAAGANSAGVNESSFLMDVSEAADLFSKEDGDKDSVTEEAAGSAGDTSVVLELVRSDTLSTEELIELYSKKPGVLFAEPNYVYYPEAEVSENASAVSGNSDKSREPVIEDAEDQADKGVVLPNAGAVSENTSAVSENSGSVSGNNKKTDIKVCGSDEQPASSEVLTQDFTDVQYAYGNGPGGIDVPDWNNLSNLNAEGVVVAVLDTGVDYNNEDLKNVMWDKGLDYPALTALGGGKYGINTGAEYYDGEHEKAKDDPMDFFGHGTHCAGIIAAEWNGIGISGAANGAKIMAVKHDVDDSGTSRNTTTIMGFNYILAAKKAGVNVVAVNCSFGGPAASFAFACCAKELGENGVVTCAASGNEHENIDIGSVSPAMFTSIPQLITVDSMDMNGKPSTFSNYGIRTTSVYAPGTEIFSTVPDDAASAYPKPDLHRSGPVKVSGKDVAVSFNQAPPSENPLKFKLSPAAISFNGVMNISNTEKDDSMPSIYLGKAFSVSVNLPDPAAGRHYYLVFSKKVDSEDGWCFPVMAKRKDGRTGLLSNSLSNTNRDFSYEVYRIDEKAFELQDLELEFYLYYPDGMVDHAPRAAIGEIWITDEAYPYKYEDGTSMATPAVAGEVAVLAGKFKDDPADKRAARVAAGVKRSSDLSELCITGGAANVRNSLDEAKYTPVINSINANDGEIKINGFFFGGNPAVSITQGSTTLSSTDTLRITSVENQTDGSGVITIAYPDGLIRGEEVKVTVTDSTKQPEIKDFTRILPLIDIRAESTQDGDLYKRVMLTDEAKDALSNAVLLNAECLGGSIYYLCENEETDELCSVRYQNGTISKTQDPIRYSGNIALWNRMLVYADRDKTGTIIFHDGNRIVKTKSFVPDGTEVPVSGDLTEVLDPPGSTYERFDLYYDGKDLILIRGMDIKDRQTGDFIRSISAVYRMDPVSCRGTYLGALKNVYTDGVVIAHEERADSHDTNTFYIIGRGEDEKETKRDFLGEKFTVSPALNSVGIDYAAPSDFKFNLNECWNGCGVKGGIYITGAHTVEGTENIKNIKADNYFYDYANPSAGFQKCTKKISDMTVYHPLVAAYDNKVTFLALSKEGYLMCTTDAETLPAYGDEVVCSHPQTELKNVLAATCSKQGYSGDRVCTECGLTVESGTATPIDPDNHDFDFENGDVTKAATRYSYGEHTYHCRYNSAHTITVKDIPLLPSGDDTDYADFADDTKDLSGNAAPVIETGRDEKGNETETVKVAGQEISKTVTDKETGKETVQSVVWITGLEKSYVYTGEEIRPKIHVYDGTRKLAEKTDYTLSYTNNKDASSSAAITVKFTGNYEGTVSQTVFFEIAKAELGKDIIAHDNGATSAKKAKKTVPLFTWASTGKSLNSKYFDLSYDDVTGNACRVNVTPKADNGRNFDGRTSASINIVSNKNLLMSNAKVSFIPKSYPYTGQEIKPSYKVTLGGSVLNKDIDYVEILQNNTAPGTASLIIEAKPGNNRGYVGSRSVTFKITGTRELKDADPFSFEVQKKAPYAKGGAMALVTVKDGSTVLKEGKDYSLSYKNNKAVTNGETAEVKIKGKGNYKGSVTRKFAVGKQELSELKDNIVTTDQFVIKSKLKKPSIMITDLDGKKLSLKKDYIVEKTEDDPKNTDSEGTVYVTITQGSGGAYEGSVTSSFRYMEPSANIGKAKVAGKIPDQIYTGSALKLSNTDLNGVLASGGNILVPGKDFVIEGYKNNKKKGTAKVTVKGTGSTAGRKTLSFKIVTKKADYKGTLVDGDWK